jgi:hypothetical protein
VRRDAPAGILVSTATFFVLVNLVLAQAVVLIFYPDAGTRLGPAGMAALCLAAVACGVHALRGWRTYLRRPPDEGGG